MLPPRSSRPRPGLSRKKQSTVVSLRSSGLGGTEITPEHPADGQQLVNAVGAAVSGRDRRAATFREFRGELWILTDRGEVTAHLGAAPGNQKIFAGREQPLGVVPRRTDQRNPAGESLEYPDRRNPGQHPNIGPPRYVDGHGGRGKGVGNPEVRKVSGKFHARFAQCPPRVLRIAHAVYPGRKPELADRLHQKFPQFCASLVVTPVADPHQIASPRDFRPRSKGSKVGSFVPNERPMPPAPPDIGFAQRLAESEYAVEPVEIYCAYGIRLARHTVMSVMKQQQIRTAGLAVRR